MQCGQLKEEETPPGRMWNDTLLGASLKQWHWWSWDFLAGFFMAPFLYDFTRKGKVVLSFFRMSC